MSIFQSVLITGANRGIGLQFVKDFLKLGVNVIGTYRDPNTINELIELSKNCKSNSSLNLLKLDVKNYDSFDDFRLKVAELVGENGLNCLINNAGIAIGANLETINPEKMIENFEVNAVSPLMLSKALLPLLKTSADKGKKTVICHISSRMGSIDDNTSGSYYAYRASKTALNQIAKSMSIDLKNYKIEVTLLHPGWVKTELGTKNALLTTEQSLAGMMAVLNDPTRDLNGKFFNYDGNQIPW